MQNTDYKLPDTEVAKNLTTLGLPKNVESFDLARYPNLKRLDADNSRLRYSTLKNYRRIDFLASSSIYLLTSPSHPNDPNWFENSDTIDLSSEAVINGVETVFL